MKVTLINKQEEERPARARETKTKQTAINRSARVTKKKHTVINRFTEITKTVEDH